MKNKLGYILAIIISLFVGISGTLLVIYYIPTNNIYDEQIVNNKHVTITENETIAPAVDKVYDSVVTVSSYNDGLTSIGTGFVYKTDEKYGYILTNNHVVSGAETVKVTNIADVTVDATLLGCDEYADLAVLKVEKSFVIKTAIIGSSTILEIGDTVFTVGTPVSVTYAGSVTKGIISGTNRTVHVTLDSGNDFMMDVIQTNAAINPGNSGGPLVNINGEVVGINTLKLVEDEIEGMGFAIPIEMATSVLGRLEKNEKIERPLLGISMVDATNSYGLLHNKIYLEKNYTKGIVVVEVEKNSTAAKAGLQTKDVILKINDSDIEDTVHFKYILYKYSIGDTIEIEFERNGKIEKTSLLLENAI